MKLWLDDVRKPPDDSWTWCRSAEDAIVFARGHECEKWALDYDLGGRLAHYGAGPYDYAAPTGLAFIAAMAAEPLPARISIHSTNAGGVIEMIQALHTLAARREQDIEIIVRPMRGRIMDKTPYYGDREAVLMEARTQ